MWTQYLEYQSRHQDQMVCILDHLSHILESNSESSSVSSYNGAYSMEDETEQKLQRFSSPSVNDIDNMTVDQLRDLVKVIDIVDQLISARN
jgi:hypothetical protein